MNEFTVGRVGGKLRRTGAGIGRSWGRGRESTWSSGFRGRLAISILEEGAAAEPGSQILDLALKAIFVVVLGRDAGRRHDRLRLSVRLGSGKIKRRQVSSEGLRDCTLLGGREGAGHRLLAKEVSEVAQVVRKTTSWRHRTRIMESRRNSARSRDASALIHRRSGLGRVNRQLRTSGKANAHTRHVGMMSGQSSNVSKARGVRSVCRINVRKGLGMMKEGRRLLAGSLLRRAAGGSRGLGQRHRAR